MYALDLAGRLNTVQMIPVFNTTLNLIKNQYDYLLVLDLEATCWDHPEPKPPPEIIEFAVVLYEIHSNSILEQFQQYVRPTENPTLTEFCINLTGITQLQVNNAVDIRTCLYLFHSWLWTITNKHTLTFNNLNIFNRRLVTFATWSNWDLGSCLPYELQRKFIIKPEYFSFWLDLRMLYVKHYLHFPKGLSGALTRLGLSFIGHQHSGLDDARNTAFLAGRMRDTGVMLNVEQLTTCESF